MPQFHETGYGRRFFESQLPTLTSNIEKLTQVIEKAGEKTEYDKFIFMLHDMKMEYSISSSPDGKETNVHIAKKYIFGRGVSEWNFRKDTGDLIGINT